MLFDFGHTCRMKLYETLDVELTYQNFGSVWLGVIRGATAELELAFNGLYNFGATNGALSFEDHAHCIATFWSSKRAMRHYFFYQHYIPRFKGERHEKHGKLVRQSMRLAQQKLAALADNHEAFRCMRSFVPDVFLCGKIGAERPDVDMKDAILEHAFNEKPSVAHSTVDTE